MSKLQVSRACHRTPQHGTSPLKEMFGVADTVKLWCALVVRFGHKRHVCVREMWPVKCGRDVSSSLEPVTLHLLVSGVLGTSNPHLAN